MVKFEENRERNEDVTLRSVEGIGDFLMPGALQKGSRISTKKKTRKKTRNHEFVMACSVTKKMQQLYFILYSKPSTQIIEMSQNNIISCDLLDNARKHIWFLKQVHANTAISLSDYDVSPAAIESIRRYQDLWLPLVAATSTQGSNNSKPVILIPPPDIAWVWHCHRLAPKHYCVYCNDTFGYVIEANPPFTLALPQTDTDNVYTTATQNLWNTHYPQESFYLLDFPAHSHTSIDVDCVMIGKFNILESMKRQVTFLWQVSGERYDDDDFLKEGVRRYARFLLLKSMKRNDILVPTYQIDLMWHTHMLTSMEWYNMDCLCIMNSVFHHDDSYTNRSEGGVLDVSYNATRTLWESVYGTEYVVPDGMYRGEPPKEFFSPQWKPDKPSLPSQWAELSGTASDGSLAFVLTSGQTRYAIKDLENMEKYVLGRIESKIGYYHIETREAHTILLMRVIAHIRLGEADVAMAKSCCGPSAQISKYEKKLVPLNEARALLQERLSATAPRGATKTIQVAESAVYSRNGAWLYPVAFYECAGGACGGAVATGAGGTYFCKTAGEVNLSQFFSLNDQYYVICYIHLLYFQYRLRGERLCRRRRWLCWLWWCLRRSPL
jgi:hypothetical protein